MARYRCSSPIAGADAAAAAEEDVADEGGALVGGAGGECAAVATPS
uniref:PRM1 protein n=1 Tax=Bos taurus TaxID=9913 RepID=Q32P95_BOVIN|nr:PRM1 protein [Bos taurus]